MCTEHEQRTLRNRHTEEGEKKQKQILPSPTKNAHHLPLDGELAAFVRFVLAILHRNPLVHTNTPDECIGGGSGVLLLLEKEMECAFAPASDVIPANPAPPPIGQAFFSCGVWVLAEGKIGLHDPIAHMMVVVVVCGAFLLHKTHSEQPTCSAFVKKLKIDSSSKRGSHAGMGISLKYVYPVCGLGNGYYFKGFLY